MNGQDVRISAPPLAVLDTNTVLDMLLFEDAAATPLRLAIEAQMLRWVGTARMLEELKGVLRRARMGRWSPPERADAVLSFALRWMQAVSAPSTGQAPRCRDETDQVFIDLACSTGAKWLLTRDKALLKLARPTASCGLTVCTPAAWAGVGWSALHGAQRSTLTA